MKDVLILLGPTGVGKTGASIRLAQELGTEIISADSMQVYRGMDIGTAKPTRQQQETVPHHLIDVVDVQAAFSAGEYLGAVAPIIERLHAQGRLPLVVGGTGLYLRAMTRGLFQGPAADNDLREELMEKEAAEPGSLFRTLGRQDPTAAARINPNDLRRIVRALEVHIATGRAISTLQQASTEPLPYRFLKIGLTRERRELYRLIDARVDAMVSEGLVNEVRTVREAKPCPVPLQAIGYKELIRHLENEIRLDEAISLIKRNSRRYAKRQYIWFRQEPDIVWADITGIFDEEAICERIRKALAAEGVRAVSAHDS